MQPPEMQPSLSLTSIIIAFIIAIALIFLLMKIKASIFLRLWFFFVVIVALGITFNAVFSNFTIYASYIAIVVAIPLAFFKIFKMNITVHNLTELLIYPGIAAVFVPILSLWAIMVLLILISIYDIYAVWHSGFMQKMAKYQINQLKIFSGFFVPYLSSKQRKEIQLIKSKYKNKIPKKFKNKKIKVNLAILGGGDVVFPIIFAGVVFQALGLIPALITSFFATLALFLLFIFARKGKFYPAMPFLSAGCFLGLLAGYLVSLI
jgi:presenilin-like A22 family membrane protease